mmetsp:Transcript_16244/g.47687  ORF Transcript_16244/g.47687 Transcript_16244/m.47687 type:complete len:326 (+) Transcript_16244:361-1338(+)
MRPGRMRAGSRVSGWFVVMTRMRFGVSTTPSSTFRSPARFSLSFSWEDRIMVGPAATPMDPPLPPLLPPSMSDKSVAMARLGSAAPSSSSPSSPRGSAPAAGMPSDESPVTDVLIFVLVRPPLPRSLPTSSEETSMPPSRSRSRVLACLFTRLLTVSPSLRVRSMALTSTFSPSSSTGSMVAMAASADRAAALSSGDLSINFLTSSVQSSLSRRRWKGLFNWTWTASCLVLATVLPPSRRWTILDAASTSSMTKITSLKPSLMGTSSPTTVYFWSNMISISSELVRIRERGTLTMERPVCWARALMRLVLPVPGGPWRSRPSLWG